MINIKFNRLICTIRVPVSAVHLQKILQNINRAFFTEMDNKQDTLINYI